MLFILIYCTAWRCYICNDDKLSFHTRLCVVTHAGMLFGWETIMTFVLVSVVYAVAVGEPSFGVVGPFAVGLSLFSMVFAGKPSCIPA